MVKVQQCSGLVLQMMLWDRCIVSSIKRKFDSWLFVDLHILFELSTWNCLFFWFAELAEQFHVRNLYKTRKLSSNCCLIEGTMDLSCIHLPVAWLQWVLALSDFGSLLLAPLYFKALIIICMYPLHLNFLLILVVISISSLYFWKPWHRIVLLDFGIARRWIS